MTTLSPNTVSPTAFPTPSEAAPAPLASVPVSSNTTAKPKGKSSKPRKRVNTAEKRNQHNAIERARRETLNSKFLNLARLLPSLAASRRPSKSAIVNGSIDHLTHQRDQRLLALSLLRQLCAERDELLNEVNGWRKVNGHTLKDGRSAWTDQMEEIASVEKEVFGTFASMDEGDDEEEGSIETSDQVPYGATITSNGLITPRSSTDLDAALHQQLFTSAPVEAHRANSVPVPNGPTVGLNGIHWSSDFTLGLNNQPIDPMFNTFLAEATAAVNSSSPLTSTQSAIVTPSAMSELMYTHTPSPASSNNLALLSDVNAQTTGSVSAAATVSANVAMPGLAPTPWTAEQFASMQQLVQQAQQAQFQQAQQAARQHHHQHHGQHHQHSHSHSQQMPFNPITGNTFNAMFGDQIQSNVMPQPHTFNPTTAGAGAGSAMPMQNDINIQALMASAFPQHGKVGTMGAVSMQDIQKAVRLGIGMAGGNPAGQINPWLGLGQVQQTPPVEGY